MSWSFLGRTPPPTQTFDPRPKKEFVNFSAFLRNSPELEYYKRTSTKLNDFLKKNTITVYMSKKHLHEYHGLVNYELTELGRLMEYNWNADNVLYRGSVEQDSQRWTITVMTSTGKTQVMSVYDIPSTSEISQDQIFILKSSLPEDYRKKEYQNAGRSRSRKIQRKRRRTKRRVRRTKKQ